MTLDCEYTDAGDFEGSSEEVGTQPLKLLKGESEGEEDQSISVSFNAFKEEIEEDEVPDSVSMDDIKEEHEQMNDLSETGIEEIAEFEVLDSVSMDCVKEEHEEVNDDSKNIIKGKQVQGDCSNFLLSGSIIKEEQDDDWSTSLSLKSPKKEKCIEEYQFASGSGIFLQEDSEEEDYKFDLSVLTSVKEEGEEDPLGVCSESGGVSEDEERELPTGRTIDKSIPHTVVSSCLQTQVGERPLTCNECGKLFTLKSSLNTHMHLHTEERPFKCNWCEKAFVTSSNLRRHSLIHTGERVTCTECGKSFTESGHLKAHMLTHTGERPCKCNVCGKSFTLKHHLLRHMRQHTKERPFTCNDC